MKPDFLTVERVHSVEYKTIAEDFLCKHEASSFVNDLVERGALRTDIRFYKQYGTVSHDEEFMEIFYSPHEAIDHADFHNRIILAELVDGDRFKVLDGDKYHPYIVHDMRTTELIRRYDPTEMYDYIKSIKYHW